ncbi:MAG: YicC/YloC family endoribonuclease [Bacteroidota bacterium]|nr:YicC/YloC family endoribonuclease [Bacteroidota bacterium]
MLQSMTGYGKAEKEYNGKKITVELKTLNSKQIDINTRMSGAFRSKDLEIRKYLSKRLHRGKLDFSIYVENFGSKSNYTINKELAKQYYNELKSLSSDINTESFTDYLPIIIKMPDVLINEREDLQDEEWDTVFSTITECVDSVLQYRIDEGKTLEQDFITRINLIEEYLGKIEPFEQLRIETVRTKLKKDLNDLLDDTQYDKNRFEQEAIYYLEKYDITEEKVRLKNHCQYFRDNLNNKLSSGKKLNFISQEVGREINTIGSKANNTDIQHIVVLMKDELEKIKEQLSNIS